MKLAIVLFACFVFVHGEIDFSPQTFEDLETHARFGDIVFLVFSNRTTFVLGKAPENQTYLLGLNSSVTEVKEPQELEQLRGEKIVKFLICSSHAAALGHRGKVFTWGTNVWGQLGVGLEDEQRTEVPRQVKSLKSIRIKDIDCGEHHTVALTKDGEVWSWGANDVKQLGANKPERSKPVPVKVRGFREKIEHISAAGQHSLAIDDDDEAYSWGDGQPVMRIEMQRNDGDNDKLKVKAVQAGKDGKDFFLVKGEQLFVRNGTEQVAVKLDSTDDYKTILEALKKKDD